MTKQEDLVLKDIELCKKVQPIMERLGIEPDGYWCYGLEFENDELIWTFLDPGEKEQVVMLHGFKASKLKFIPTVRQDKLALGLPDWCFTNSRSGWWKTDKEEIVSLVRKIRTLFFFQTKDFMNREHMIQQQLEATAKLLILLEDNGLGKKEI